MDHNAVPVYYGCTVDNADCYAICKCDGAYGGSLCNKNVTTVQTEGNMTLAACRVIVDTDYGSSVNIETFNTILGSIHNAFDPYLFKEMTRADYDVCASAIQKVFEFIDNDYDLLVHSNSNSDNLQKMADLISSTIEYFIDTDRYASDISMFSAWSEDLTAISRLAQLLQKEMGEALAPDEDPVEVTSSHISVSSRFVSIETFLDSTIVPPSTADQTKYSHDQTAVTFGASGISRCLNTNAEDVWYGILEWGISPTANVTLSENVDTELVQITFKAPTTTPSLDIDDRISYNVTYHYQEALNFSISTFNRTFPATYSLEGNEFHDTLFTSCNVSYDPITLSQFDPITDDSVWSSDTASFECADVGQMCAADTDSSGDVVVMGGENYYVNTLAAGTFFLEGRVTSAPTSQPSSAPSSSSPTFVPTQDFLTYTTFSVAVEQNFSSVSFDITQTSYTDPIRIAIASLITSQSSGRRLAGSRTVFPKDVNITSVFATADSKTGVKFEIEVIAEELGFDGSDLSGAVSYIQDQLNTGTTVASGETQSPYLIALISASASNPSIQSEFTNAVISTFSVDPTPLDVDVESQSPSSQPTGMPSYGETFTAEEIFGLDDGTLAIIIVGSIVSLSIFTLVMYVMIYRKRHDLGKNLESDGLTSPIADAENSSSSVPRPEILNYSSNSGSDKNSTSTRI
jgi:hypothetical protein